MKVEYKPSFLKSLKTLPKSVRENIETFAFKILPSLDSINQIKNLKKLRASTNAYRVRFGKYRLGLKLEKECLTVMTADSRGEFYRNFP